MTSGAGNSSASRPFPRPVRRAALPGCVMALSLAAAFVLPAAAAPPVFEQTEAVEAFTTVPVMGEDIAAAHRQALESAFRLAVVEAARELGPPIGPMAEARAAGDPGRYVKAYQIAAQMRRDLFYQLKVLVWVDRRLLRDEASGEAAQ